MLTRTSIWGTAQPSPDSTMDPRLLCWVTLCLLGQGHTGPGVSQFPRHRVTERGQNVTLGCDPISGHTVLYWYRQTTGKGLEFLVYFQNTDAVDKSGMTNDRLSVQRSKGTNSTLQIQRAEQGDSAVYLCASSPTTVGHRPLLAPHKPRGLTPPRSQDL
uniref:Ig-like domain-containing protein n=1 Tax=Mustela putorius furo TaxID=9669 RepID=M3YAZ8_MUSPF